MRGYAISKSNSPNSQGVLCKLVASQWLIIAASQVARLWVVQKILGP